MAARASLIALLAMAIGFGDWVTGIELPFTILYLVPVALGVQLTVAVVA